MTANTIQDFLQLTRRETKGEFDLSFLFNMPSDEQRAALHDLTVIKKKDSKTVRHGIDMIRHLNAAPSLSAALGFYLIETLEEEIEEGKDGTAGKRQLLKSCIEGDVDDTP